MSSHNPGKARFIKKNYPERFTRNAQPSEIIDVTHEDPRNDLALTSVYKLVDIRTARKILKGSVQQLFSDSEEHVAPRAAGTSVPEVQFKNPDPDPES